MAANPFPSTMSASLSPSSPPTSWPQGQWKTALQVALSLKEGQFSSLALSL